MSMRGKNFSGYNLLNQTLKRKNNFLLSELNTFCILEKVFIVTGKRRNIRDFFFKLFLQFSKEYVLVLYSSTFLHYLQ